MAKYKQAVSIISNAPPVRLTYPKFAKAENPPLSRREIRFLNSDDLRLPVTPPVAEPMEHSINQTLAIHREEAELERPLRPESEKGKQARWQEANSAIKDAATQKLEFEAEYDPASLDEEQLPLFDLGSREL